MACDIQELLDDASCLQCAIPQGLLGYAQLASLCLLTDSGGGGLFVLRAGDTMTGVLVLDDALPSLKFGGTTSSFPALGNSGAFLQARLADNSAYAIFQAGFTQANQVDTGINTQPVAFEAYHDTSAGTPAANCGVAIDMRADSDTTDRQLQVRLTSLWTIAAHATRTSEFRFSTVLASVTTECMRISNAAVDLRNGADLQIDGTAYFNPLSVYATGTVYTLTAVSAGVDFGTTDPIITVNQVGNYKISARVKVALNGATFAANRTLTVKLRRTNNTPADVTSSSTTWIVPVVTTITNTLAVIQLPDVYYSTANATDTIQIFADISVLPTVGTISIDEASIVAVRLNI